MFRSRKKDRPTPAARQRTDRFYRPSLEALEDRLAPATLTVNNTGDTGTDSLRQRIIDAAAGDTINFNIALTGQTILLASEIALNKAVTIAGLGAGKTIISGQNTSRVFNVTAAATVTDVTLTRGNAGAGNSGGAVLATGVTFTLNNSEITNSQSAVSGGGITVTGAAGVLNATGDTIGANRSGQQGGGVDVRGGATANITNSTITGNNGSGSFDGGGIYVDTGTNTLNLTDSTVSYNFGTGAFFFGGGLENNGGTATILRSTFVGNSAGGEGGAIEARGGTTTIKNSTIVSNNANGGGNGGGGINVAAGTTVIVNSTITNNSSGVAAKGGGFNVVAGATATIQNSIIADNTVTAAGNLDGSGTLTNNSTNNLYTITTGITNPGGAASTTIFLGPLQDNGGATFTRAPLFGSSAIDAGNNPAATAAALTTTDQRAASRLVNTTVDVGAVEFQSAGVAFGSPSTTTTLAITPAASGTFGAAVQFAATVAPVAGGASTPTGTVTYLLNGNPFATAALGAGGTVTYVSADLPTGTFTISARYNADSKQGFSTSSSAGTSYTVNASAATTATTTTLTADVNPVVAGATATFTALVTASSGTASPAGSVVFSSDNLLIGTSALDGTGKATISTNALTIGFHQIRAYYGGNATFLASSASPPLKEFVQSTSTIATTTTLAASVTTTQLLFQPVTYTAQVTPSATGSGPVQGFVTFKSGTFVIGTAEVNSAGVAALTTTRTPRTATSITAVYSGDSQFATSTSTGVTVKVTAQRTVGSYDPTSGNWFERNSNSAGTADFGFVYGLPNWKGVTGDWDGNGATTPAVIDPTSNTWYITNTNPASTVTAQFVFGMPGWIPISGDWTGTGQTGIGVVDPATMTWYLKDTATNAAPVRSFVFGSVGQTPVTGSWAGTVSASGFQIFGIGVFNPSNANWALRNTADAGPASLPTIVFGGPNWKPVTGDWTGSGVTRIGVTIGADGSNVNAVNANFFLAQNNATGTALVTPAFGFGFSYWTPLSGTWGAKPTVVPLPQTALGTGPGTADLLNQAKLDSAVDGALGRLAGAGVSQDVLGQLRTAQYIVGTLGGSTLALTDVNSRTVTVDSDAAGYGWNTDLSDAAFRGGRAVPASNAAGREDLLTVVLHEMSHLVGWGESQGDPYGADLLTELLAPGVRRTEALDLIFRGK